MTDKKLEEITQSVAEVYTNGAELYVGIKGEDADKRMDIVAMLLDVIASLHNELYRAVTGEYYDYMFHWANLGYGGSPDDGMFKDKEDEECTEKKQ